MVKIPFIKIPSVRVGSIDPTSDIGTGGATSAPPTPITYLTRWKIVGNSEVHGNEMWSCGEPITESFTLFDGTQELLDGFLPSSGAYPTTAISYPNAKYYVFDVKAGYTITNNIGFNTRLRLIVNKNVYQNINKNSDNEYLISTYDPVSDPNGYVHIRKDCKIGLLVIDTTQSYAGSVVASYVKYHILVQPQGGSIADIALTEPLRKVNDVTDSIEFANGVATLTRRIKSYVLSNTPEWLRWSTMGDKTNIRYITSNVPLVNGVLPPNTNVVGIALCAIYPTISVNRVNGRTTGISIEASGRIGIYDADYAEEVTNDAFIEHIQGVEVYYQLTTPTTELVDAPQIEEADSYSMVISQGGKAVSWSSFETDSE